MVTEAELLAAIAAAPDDDDVRLVYADWLIARGDERGELVALDLADLRGRELSDLEPLLRLAAIHGFPRWPDDPSDELLSLHRNPYLGMTFQGRVCQLRYRAGLIEITTWLIDVDGVAISDADVRAYPVEFRDPDHLDAHQTDVILSILGRALRLDRDLMTLAMPTRGAIEDLERYTRKRPAHYHQALGMQASGRPLRPHPAFGVIDYERWGELWTARMAMRR